MLAKKQHSFDDAIAGAEYLVKHNYMRSQMLAIEGGSNGGLMVSAVVTERPELFGAAICSVPLTDMVRFPLIGNGFWYLSEYGDPKNEQDFKTLYAYSPYHHVSSNTAYPAMLFFAAGADTRVTPVHAFKAVAALQADKATKNPILMSYSKERGHQRATPEQIWDAQADGYGFVMKKFKMSLPEKTSTSIENSVISRE